MQTITLHKRGNQTKLGRVEAMMAEILAETCKPGFHGRASIEMVIHDGTLQRLRRTVERVER